MSNQSTTSNRRRHICKGNAPLRGCIRFLLILNNIHNIATYRWWARLHSKTPVAKKSEFLTTQTCNLRCESSGYHHTAEQYSKTGRAKLKKYLRRSDRSCLYFLIIPSIRAAALDTEWRCFSMVILASNVTHNITGSADSFTTVPSRVNGVYWGWIVRDLETVIFLVLLTFYFVHHWSHHILTLFRSRFRDSVTATLSPVDGTTATKVESSA